MKSGKNIPSVLKVSAVFLLLYVAGAPAWAKSHSFANGARVELVEEPGILERFKFFSSEPAAEALPFAESPFANPQAGGVSSRFSRIFKPEHEPLEPEWVATDDFILLQDSNGLKIFSSRGRFIYSTPLPTEPKSVVLRKVEYKGRTLYVLSIDSERSPGTFVIDPDLEAIVKISGSSSTSLKVNVSSEGLLEVVGFPRVVDLEAIEFEAAVETHSSERSNGITTSYRGNKVQVSEYDEGVGSFLENFRTKVEGKRKLPLNEGDQEVLNKVLASIKKRGARSVVLLGKPGNGKSTLLDALVDYLPRTWGLYSLARAHLEANSMYRGQSEKKVQQMIAASRKRVIFYFADELHTLKGAGTHSNSDVDALQMLKDPMASGDFNIIGTDDFESYRKAFGGDPAMMRRFTSIRTLAVEGEAAVAEKLRGWFSLKGIRPYSNDIFQYIARVAATYDPAMADPGRSVALTQQLISDLNAKKISEPTYDLVDAAAWNLYDVGPVDPQKFVQQIEEARSKMKGEIVEQDEAVDTLLDLYWDSVMNTGRSKVRSLLVAGPTGAGKTFLGQVFAKYVLGDATRVLEIDATKYLSGGHSLDSLIGSAAYSANSPVGLLPEFLRGSGKGRNVIIINEVEKAHPDFIKIIMEYLDTGKIQAGDGRIDHGGQSIVILNSNKGADSIYPRGYRQSLSAQQRKERIAFFNDQRVKNLFMEASPDNLDNRSGVWGMAELQRIDAALAMLPPSEAGALVLAKLQRDILHREAMAEMKSVSVQLSDEILERLVKTDYRPETGARPLQRLVRKITAEISQNLISANLGGAARVTREYAVTFENPLKAVRELNPTLVARSGESTQVLSDVLKPRQNLSVFENPEKLAVIKNFHSAAKALLYGQDEAIEVSERVIRSRLVNSQENRPATLLFLGSGGIGKTELARLIAKHICGSEERLGKYEMGDVKHEGDFNNIFNPPKGYQGANTISRFERALIDFPDCYVHLFDEAGNMGHDPSDPQPSTATGKGELLKKFYPLIEDGVWTSSQGKTYSLAQHIIIFTANDGAELLEKAPNDDLRMADWNYYNRKDRIEDILRHHGWPAPLISRLGNGVVLFKPLIGPEQAQISNKETSRALAGMIEEYQLGKISFAEGYHERAAQSFFSHSLGGRSVRDLASVALVDLIGQALTKYYGTIDFSQVEFFVDIQDNYAGISTFRGERPPEREVKLSLLLKHKGLGLDRFENDVSRDAALKKLWLFKDVAMVAYHEAGHLVGNDEELTHTQSELITIQGAGGFGGYVRWEELQKFGVTREEAVARIAMMLGGMHAEILAGFPKSSGWQADREQATRFAQMCVAIYGLGDTTLRLPVKDGKVIIEAKETQKEIHKLLAEADAQIKKRLVERWPQLRLVALRVLEKKTLNREEILSVLREGEQLLPEWQKSVLARQAKAKAESRVLPKRVRACADYLESR